MKREAAATQKSKGKFTPPEDPAFASRPLLAEAVADLFWEDGTPREPWSISLNWSTGMCMVSLNDKDESRSMNSSAPTMEEALDLMEGLLASPRRPWRYWGRGKARK